MSSQKVNPTLGNTYKLVVRTVSSKKDPVKNVNVKVFRLEKEPISVEQWTENLRNGSPFKRLISSQSTDATGTLTVELVAGVYDVEVEKYGSKVCEIEEDTEVVFVEAKKHWWQ